MVGGGGQAVWVPAKCARAVCLPIKPVSSSGAGAESSPHQLSCVVSVLYEIEADARGRGHALAGGRGLGQPEQMSSQNMR